MSDSGVFSFSLHIGLDHGAAGEPQGSWYANELLF